MSPSSSILNAWRLAAARCSPSSSSSATSTTRTLASTLPWSRHQLSSSSARARLYSTGLGALRPSGRLEHPRWINSKTGQEGGEGDGLPEEVGKEGGKESGETGKEKESSGEPEGSSSSSPPSSEGSGSSASSSSPSSSSSSPPPPSSSSTPPSSGSSSSSNNSSTGSSSSVIKPTIPSSYPYPLLALPIARRPLFPGFYKAVVIRNPAVVSAIKEMMKRGQPYLGAFLLKDKSSSPSSASTTTATSDSTSTSASTATSEEKEDNEPIVVRETRDEDDKDVIDSLDEVYDVGVFCQVTSVFAAAPAKSDSPPSSGSSSSSSKDKDGAAAPPQEEALTAVLYPHRRIKITELVKAGPGGEQQKILKVDEKDVEWVDHVEGGEKKLELPVTPPASPAPGEEASSTPAPSDDSAAAASSTTPPPPAATPTSFLNSYPVSLVRIKNLPTEAYTKDNQYIRAFTSEIVSVFKDIAQLNPLFRDQITNFSINQVTSANIFDEPDKLADFAAAVSSGEPQELQGVLESTKVDERLRRALTVLKKELINAELQSKIARDVDGRIAKRQREYYLMEQMRGIKKELGLESDGKDKLIAQLKEKAAKLNMPEVVRKVFEEELNKLQGLEASTSEANVTRNYLDWLTVLPWGVHTPENYNLTRAKGVLDADHYGLKEVKARILEFLAVGKLRGTVEGKIICLVGPPGVGKTSIGKSIAHCVGRRFVRFSVGGLTDVAEIKGHRRTYVGALPGKIVQSLKRVGTENPVVVIDEIDKIGTGRGVNGDPASALLEMLDPEQNASFLDHYLDVPIDLSRVLFVCTANTLDTIPAPLLDRMEVLEVSGYVSEEKSVIARRYLGPQAKASCGLGDADVEITEGAVDVLIKWYARESGVRNLKKYIEKIYRKAALKLVEELGEETFPEPKSAVASTAAEQKEDGAPAPASEQPKDDSSSSETSTPSSSQTPPPTVENLPEPNEDLPKETTTKERKPMVIPDTVHMRITPENLKEYVGPPVYQRDRMFGGTTRPESQPSETGKSENESDKKGSSSSSSYDTEAPPGVSTGLGYLGNGSGAVMPIEAVAMPGKGSLQLTGKLGEVIRESAQIALSWVKAHAFDLGVTNTPSETLLLDKDIHIHMPEGAVGKDGPSAGTAILVALVSLVTGKRVHGDTAMTGEMSLTGRVLAVGGLKEKILAAHRAEMKTLIIPGANRMDVEENVPDSVKEGIKFVYVESVNEVLAEVFGIKVGERERKWKEDTKYEKEKEWKKEKQHKEKERRRE